MAKNEQVKKLDTIIEDTLKSINDSKEEINDIRAFAKKEYTEMYDEFIYLKSEAESIIDKVDSLSIELKKSKDKLMKINKNFSQYTEAEMKKVYDETDHIRVSLAIEKEREKNVIRRRNELEIHLGTVKTIYEKAEKLSVDFNMAYSVLSGDFKLITEQIDGIQNKEIWGMKILEAQESERKRIARDMHDGPTQMLSNLILKTELCIKLLDKDLNRTKIEMNSLKFLIREIIDETRRLIHNLRPMSIDDLGLAVTIERLVEEVKHISNCDINVEIDREVKKVKINSIIVVTIYRICQEALNNIIKHSMASRVDIYIGLKKEHLKLNINDNGVGFEQDKVKLRLDDNRGFGLSTMKERANLMMGNIEIQSELNKGTCIELTIPLYTREELKNGQ